MGLERFPRRRKVLEIETELCEWWQVLGLVQNSDYKLQQWFPGLEYDEVEKPGRIEMCGDIHIHSEMWMWMSPHILKRLIQFY